MTRKPDEQDPTIDATSAGSLPAGVPRTIGHYKIQSVIDAGGMGTVYKALQEKPRRVVAVKVMRFGVTSASALRRFEYESQLLGRLRHPGVAQVYEAGTYDDGTGQSVPFFAMEYIPSAKSITAHATDKGLSTRDRLGLMAKVCDAVHHGHQKGIVHRDLKPANILVGPAGNPRVIDFGVARATDSDMALTAGQTEVGQLVGTVQYMSPEQCEADPEDIDTRSDVYALGIVLYELLCGELPYRLENTPIFEATRVIRETHPARLSEINPKLRGDVETIALKALEKDRDRRYQSAAELAQDIRRYLGGEAIAARPASFTYQVSVFARRNKGMLAALATVFVAVVAGAVISTALYFRGETNRVRAEQQQQRAEAAQGYLQDILSSLDPTRYGDQVHVSELLDKYGAGIEERFADQPEAEVAVRGALAQSYMHLNYLQHTDRSDAHLKSAVEHMSRAYELQRELFGAEHPKTLQMLELHATILRFVDPDRAEQMRREVLRDYEKEYGKDHERSIAAASSLAGLLRVLERYEEAEALTRRVLEVRQSRLDPDDPRVLSAMALLGRIRQELGYLDEAERLKADVLERTERAANPGPKALYNARAAMASAWIEQGKLEQARDLFETSIRPEDFAIEKWYQGGSGSDQIDVDDSVVVFWEPWCPYSKAFVPSLQELYVEHPDSKVEIVGLTSLSRNTTEEQALQFIKGSGLTFANAQSTGETFSELGFTGNPAAVALKDGHVVFKGHPELITPAFLAALER